MRLGNDIGIAPHVIVRKQGWKPLAKTSEDGRKRRNAQQTHRWLIMVRSSSTSKLLTPSCSLVASISSFRIPTFQFSSSFKGKYLIWRQSEGESSWMLIFSVSNRIFLKFDPVMLFVSFFTVLSNILQPSFPDFSICSKKFRNLLIKTDLICGVWLRGSMSFLCVWIGRFIISYMAVFQVE